MKKLVAIILALALTLILLVGCGGAPASSGTTASSGAPAWVM